MAARQPAHPAPPPAEPSEFLGALGEKRRNGAICNKRNNFRKNIFS